MDAQFSAMVQSALKFYGAAHVAQDGLTDRQAAKIANVSTKSWADDYLMAKFRVERWLAHDVTNHITHHNLRHIEDHPAHYAGFPFYNEWVKLLVGLTVHATAMPDDSFYREIKGVVTAVRNGWVTIRADQVLDKYSEEWHAHPSSCLTSTLLQHIEVEANDV